MSDDDLLLRFDGPGELALIVESDERAAYAYLTESRRIVGDVWLRNILPAPERFEASRGEPPLNVAGDIRSDVVLPSMTAETLSVDWFADGADVHADGIWIATVRRGSRPGWSLLAKNANPCARPLAEMREQRNELR